MPKLENTFNHSNIVIHWEAISTSPTDIVKLDTNTPGAVYAAELFHNTGVSVGVVSIAPKSTGYANVTLSGSDIGSGGTYKLQLPLNDRLTVFSARVKFLRLSSPADVFMFIAGMSQEAFWGDIGDFNLRELTFRYSHNLYGDGNLKAVAKYPLDGTVEDAVTTVVNTKIPVVAGQWYKLVIEVLGNVAYYYIDDTLAATIVHDIKAIPLTSGMVIHKTTHSNNNKVVHVDYITLEQQFEKRLLR